MTEIILVASSFAVLAALGVTFALNARAEFLTLKAGSLSRITVTKKALDILADESSTQAAKVMAEKLIEMSFSPPTLSELEIASSKPHPSVDEFFKMVGRDADLLQHLLRHVAILVMLGDAKIANFVRKFIEGQKGIEHVISSMANEGKSDADLMIYASRDKERVALDLAGSFATVEHSAITSRIIDSLREKPVLIYA